MLILLAGLALPISGSAATVTNVALNKPVTSSGPTWTGLIPSALTDGRTDSFSHPQGETGTLGYYFEIDLGRTYRLDRIAIYNRADGCCPERLTRYRVEVYADQGGSPGVLNWSTGVRTNGSNSGVGGVDTVLPSASTNGVFVGRFVRIVNRSNAGYNPQVAEVQVYGAVPPVIRSFTADEDVLATGQSTTLRWDVVSALGVSISPDVGGVSVTNGSVVIHPDTTTVYTLTATNLAGAITATVNVGFGVQLLPPTLSEFMASNAGLLKDEDGDSSDWIELRNPNAYGLKLEGYAFTDDPTHKLKWVFPASRIPANGYLVVFASGKNRRNATLGPLHTDFKLSSAGGYLALLDKDGVTPLQRIPASYPNPAKYPKQRSNLSYGLDASAQEGFFRPATPGAPNGPAFAGLVADVTIDPGHGFFSNAVDVVMACVTKGATIRYTTNNAEPTATTGLIYQQPIHLTNTTVLRAAAFRDGWAPSPLETQTYVYLSNVIRSVVMSQTITKSPLYGPQMYSALTDLPSISIVAPNAINDTTEVACSFEWLNPNGSPGVQVGCGGRLYGGAFTAFEKKSFRFIFRSDYGASKLSYPMLQGFDHGLTPVEEFDEIELRSGSHDMAMRGFYMSNPCADDTLLDMGRLNPHGRFVHLYLNGVYWGMFHLRERWSAHMHARYTGGRTEDYESINGNWNVGGWADPGVPYDGDGSVWENVKIIKTNYNQVKVWVDVPQYVDYMLTFMFGGCEDEYRCVGPNTPGSGFKYYLNDADGWFCGSWYCAADDRTVRGAPGRQAGDGPGSIFSMLFKEGNPEYRTLLADRIYNAMFRDGPLTPGGVLRRLNARSAEMERAFLAESARWGYLTPTDWAARRDEVKTLWLPRRTTEALNQWRAAGFYPKIDAPIVAPLSSSAALPAILSFLGPTNATIYYTTNGEDPRLVGGAVSPRAKSVTVTTATEILLSSGSSWRWFSDSKGLGRSDVVLGNAAYNGTNWKHPDFNDSAWSLGKGKFGFGEGDEVTLIPATQGTDKLITSYYRTQFRLENPATIVSLAFKIRRDDGAILYLNGSEVARSSMPSGVAMPTTVASLANDDGKTVITLGGGAGLLRSGTNTIAVELHQTALADDATFDLEIVSVRAKLPPGTLPSLGTNTLVKSRSLVSNQWSAMDVKLLQVEAQALSEGDVVFSEVNFNPPGLDDTEFLELLNISGHAVNLRGAMVTNGVQYHFPGNRDILLAPGQRYLLVADLHQFQAKYGLGIDVGGVYFGALNNSGDSLSLYRGDGGWISSAHYATTPPWPIAADGSGYSLVLAYPKLGSSDPNAWRTSVSTNGSPGVSDSVAFVGDPAVDSDSDGLSDLAEFMLGTLPNDPSSGPGSIHAQFDPLGRFSIAFPRRLGADAYRLAVEASLDLSTWTPAALLETRPMSGGLALETWGAAAENQPHLFFRLVIQQNP